MGNKNIDNRKITKQNVIFFCSNFSAESNACSSGTATWPPATLARPSTAGASAYAKYASRTSRTATPTTIWCPWMSQLSSPCPSGIYSPWLISISTESENHFGTCLLGKFLKTREHIDRGVFQCFRVIFASTTLIAHTFLFLMVISCQLMYKIFFPRYMAILEWSCTYAGSHTGSVKVFPFMDKRLISNISIGKITKGLQLLIFFACYFSLRSCH